jgi:nucleoside-diphosphate-sugar epimerase
LKVLFIGGTGVISSACSKLCIEKGMNLYLLNRAESLRPIPDGAKHLQGDYRESKHIKSLLQNQEYDVVVDWIAYGPEHVQHDVELFKGRTKQYIFISSASAYQTPPAKLPVTESTPLQNPFWQYSRNKIACEDFLMNAHKADGFPVTIVRPSHTYDKMTIPFTGGFLFFDRLQRGKKIIIHGDGTSIWTLTHHRDFATGFVGLLGNPAAIGEAFHITNDEWLTWNGIAGTLAEKAGLEMRAIHLPSEFIANYDPEWGAGLLGDKAHSMIFDNSKIKSLVPEFSPSIPLSDGAKEIVEWYFADKTRQNVNAELDSLMDNMVVDYESIGF